MTESPAKKETLPLISIGVSAYNRKNYLPFCLDSLLAQTYPNCEIIVVDDGSTDGTREFMQEKYPSITYIYQENAGDAAAKNHAAKLAKGEYIVFNDSDDVFLPDTVERLYDAIKGRHDACSYGTYHTIDAKGDLLPTKGKVRQYPSGNILPVLLQHIIVNCCATMMPLSLFLENGAFDSSLRAVHDYALFLRLASKYEFFALKEPAFLRRRHASNLSSANYQKTLGSYTVFDSFIQENLQTASRYEKIVKKRYADYHNKLCREALKENRKKEALFHAEASFKLNPSMKGIYRIIKSCFL